MEDVLEQDKAESLHDLVKSLQQRVDTLEAKDAIRRVLANYCRAFDRIDYDLLMSCYHTDAVDEHGYFVANSAKEFVDFVIGSLPSGSIAKSFYNCGNVLIDLSGHVAHSECYFMSAKTMQETDAEGNPLVRLSGARFLDRFERRNGEWRIAHRVLIGDWDYFTPVLPISAGPFKANPDPATSAPTGKRDRSDRSYEFLPGAG